jgi:hypothetical protein
MNVRSWFRKLLQGLGMRQEGISLSHAALDVLFPFHLRLDARSRITHAGPSLIKVLGGIPKGDPIGVHLELQRPTSSRIVRRRSHGADPAAGTLWPPEVRVDLLGHPLVLEAKRHGITTGVTLVGQLVQPHQQDDLLVLNPLFENLEELERTGLHLHDYPIHDSTRMLLSTQLVLAGYRQSIEDLIHARGGLRLETDAQGEGQSYPQI